MASTMMASAALAAAPQRVSIRSSKAIVSSRAALVAKPKAVRRGVAVAASANMYFAEDQEYIDTVGSNFPDKGIANVEEARCLFSEYAYNILDIRAKTEIERVGAYPKQYPTDHKWNTGIFAVPMIDAVPKYDAALQKKVYNQTPNKDFLARVMKVFPNKEAKIIISCSDGRNRAVQALEALDEAGYTNIVGLRGGYNMWNRTWDAKMRRRNLPGVFAEEYSHGADTCGVHATGASFANQDSFQYPDWKDDTEWIEWK